MTFPSILCLPSRPPRWGQVPLRARKVPPTLNIAIRLPCTSMTLAELHALISCSRACNAAVFWNDTDSSAWYSDDLTTIVLCLPLYPFSTCVSRLRIGTRNRCLAYFFEPRHFLPSLASSLSQTSTAKTAALSIWFLSRCCTASRPRSRFMPSSFASPKQWRRSAGAAATSSGRVPLKASTKIETKPLTVGASGATYA